MTKERFKWYMKQIKRIGKSSKKSTDTKKVRYHAGIIQYGSNRGKLKKGYMYTGGKTKTNLSVIVKTKKKDDICSPEKKDNDKYSCLSVKALQRIAREYNKKYAKKDKIIKIHDNKRNITKSLPRKLFLYEAATMAS